MERYLPHLIGDLLEESASRGRAWFFFQIIKSIPHILLLSARRSGLEEKLLVTLLFYVLPIRLLDLLSALILSLVPLKEDAIRPAPHLLATLLLATTAAILCAKLHRGLALWLTASSLLLLATVPASLPAWYWLLMPLSCFTAVKFTERQRTPQ
jgi:hypothetical protein